MKEYVLLFRMDITAKPSQKQMDAYMHDWMQWINSIAAAKQLAEGGNHLSYTEARVLKPGNVTENKPYAVNKESVAGYIIVLAKDLDDASKIAARCPILNGEGTSVEVRAVASPQ